LATTEPPAPAVEIGSDSLLNSGEVRTLKLIGEGIAAGDVGPGRVKTLKITDNADSH